jgi:hypothetical protein
LGAILAGTVHAQSRVQYLIVHGNAENLSQNFQRGCGTIDIVPPIIDRDPVPNKFLPVHSKFTCPVSID